MQSPHQFYIISVFGVSIDSNNCAADTGFGLFNFMNENNMKNNITMQIQLEVHKIILFLFILKFGKKLIGPFFGKYLQSLPIHNS